jgi:hypothetical protein
VKPFLSKTSARVSQLFAGNGKWRAGQATCQQVDFLKASTVKFSQALMAYIPVRPVFAQGVAAVFIDFDQSTVLKAGLFQAEGLPARQLRRRVLLLLMCASVHFLTLALKVKQAVL